MKKYLKMIGNILMYGGIYLFINIVITIIFMIGTVILNLDKLENPEFIQEAALAHTQLVLIISGIVSIGIYALILMAKKKNIIKYCNFSFPGGINIVVLIFGAISLTTLSTIIMDLTDFYKYFPDTMKMIGELVTEGNFITSLLTVGILVPIIEEILFRGLIFNELRKNINIWAAIILQALIFGVFHMNLLQGFVTFFIGIVMGLVYVWVKSIWAPIIIHMVNNSISVIASYFLPASFKFEMPYVLLVILIVVFILFISLNIIRNRSDVVLKEYEYQENWI